MPLARPVPDSYPGPFERPDKPKQEDGRLRVGVLGCGPIAQAAHFESCTKARNADLCAICDVAGDLRVRMAATHQPERSCADYATMLADPDLDAVIIATSDPFHVPASIQAPEDFIIRAEQHGIPQARHRVVICGASKDVFDRAGRVGTLPRSDEAGVLDVIQGLPELRPALSHRGRGLEWVDCLSLPVMQDAIRELTDSPLEIRQDLAREMRSFIAGMNARAHLDSGSDRLPMQLANSPKKFPDWYCDRPLSLLTNHESRSHMPEDIARYFFVSAFGHVTGASSRLEDFPISLLPNHKNVDPDRPHAAIFKDRFRVQIGDRPSMTVTSHIGKDGHAFIHPDPMQCRSLTVREAARLQTFPDSYVFLGSRTSQYTQVGNAVPPKLAVQIAELVGQALSA